MNFLLFMNSKFFFWSCFLGRISRKINLMNRVSIQNKKWTIVIVVSNNCFRCKLDNSEVLNFLKYLNFKSSFFSWTKRREILRETNVKIQRCHGWKIKQFSCWKHLRVVLSPKKKMCFRFLFAAFELRNKIELHLWHVCLQNLYYSTKMSCFFEMYILEIELIQLSFFLLNQSILSCFCLYYDHGAEICKKQ